MKKLHHTIVAAIGFATLSGGLAHGGEEPANGIKALYDFPVERVHALVQLYREGGDYQTIAAPMLTKMGQPARTELLAMRRATTDAAQSRAIGEILANYFAPAQSPSKTASEQPRAKQHSVTDKAAKSAPKAQIAEQAPPARPARKPSTSAVAFGATGITNPLQPSATRF